MGVTGLDVPINSINLSQKGQGLSICDSKLKLSNTNTKLKQWMWCNLKSSLFNCLDVVQFEKFTVQLVVNCSVMAAVTSTPTHDPRLNYKVCSRPFQSHMGCKSSRGPVNRHEQSAIYTQETKDVYMKRLRNFI